MNFRRTAAWITTLTVAAGSLTCSSDISDPDPEPASLTKSGGDEQVGLINEPLADLLVVTVEDDRGQPLPGIVVSWSVGGGGSVDHAQVTTGDDGKAAVERTLGDAAGIVTTTAAVPTLPSVVFTSTASAGDVPSLTMATQPSAAAVNAIPFDRQPIVQVEDGTGQPVGAGVAVTASVDGATLNGDAVVETDGTGLVRYTDLALTGPDGDYALQFSAAGYVSVQSAPVALTATPVESDRLVITTQPSDVAENGAVLDQQPVVQAEDASGDPLGPGITVTASVQGASLAGTVSEETDANGVATFTDLALSGPSGSYTLQFAAPDFTGIESDPITLQTTASELGQWTAPITGPSWPFTPCCCPMAGSWPSTASRIRRSGTRPPGSSSPCPHRPISSAPVTRCFPTAACFSRVATSTTARACPISRSSLA